ncbi:MAG TPA: TrkH family potassium uptake protein, partial [Phycisphaerales bacterium]|nr:TrkH family potassium uptake protein [Phycisphaerales bacterium]
ALAGVESERRAAEALLIASVAGGLIGGVIWLMTRRIRGFLDKREALLLVVLSWIGAAVLGGAPYFIWAHLAGLPTHPYGSPVASIFEAMSGLTTTGATVLSDIEAVPASLLLWRAITHWLGGLGIIVLFVAVLPSLGVGGRHLFGMESPGPQPGGVHPHIRETARVLWYIYSGLTLLQILALKIAGMTFFDATCHAFATLATGGFSTKNASVGAYNASIQVIIIVFMVFAGGNFGLYHSLLRGKYRDVLRDPELRIYLAIIAFSAAAIAFWLNGTTIETTTGGRVSATTGVAIREAAFNVATIQTTTGFGISDFDIWPSPAKLLLVILMFVGGSAGSTAGGIKVIRIWIALRVLAHEIERVFRPHIVRPVRIGGKALDPSLRNSAVIYIVGMVLLFVFGAFMMLVLEGSKMDIATAITASAACLCNVGPGLSLVGPLENYGWMDDSTLAFLSLMMLMGRLEVLPVLVLIVPSYWRGE